MDISNICVFGEDGRMDYVAQIFYDRGYDVYRDLKNLNSRSVLILPPPCGEREMVQVLPYLVDGQRVYGGMVSNRFIHECALMGVCISDYLKWDQVTADNAVLTAKGIIKEAMAYGAVLQESNCLVTGYGFCGKALSGALAEHGAHVDVMVRNKSLAPVLIDEGFGYVDMAEPVWKSLEKYSYVFNTVPALVLTADVLQAFSDNVMIFDIASLPGGTDFAYCRENHIFAVNSLGIPGKEYPKEAGEIIAYAIIADMNAG